MISVCLACYNGEKFIKEQIVSILAELESKDELIISDDGSTDNTIAIIKSLTDNRIKLISNESSNHGVNANFENAIRHSKGDYIFLADQDDVWCRGKVFHCLEALRNNDCVVHNAIVTDGNLKPIGKTMFEVVNARCGVIHNWIHNGYLGCAMAFKRNLLSYILPFPSNMPMYHDIWIGTIAGVKFKVEFIDFCGILFRRHSKTTSVTFHKRKSLLRIIQNRLGILWFVGKRIMFKNNINYK